MESSISTVDLTEPSDVTPPETLNDKVSESGTVVAPALEALSVSDIDSDSFLPVSLETLSVSDTVSESETVTDPS